MDIICHNCGFHNTGDSVFCMNCGARLDGQQQDDPSPRVCSVCGARITGDYAFCPKCGAPTSSDGPQTPLSSESARPAYYAAAPVPPRKKSNTGLIIGLCIGGFALFAVAVVALVLILGFIAEPADSGASVPFTSDSSYSYSVPESSAVTPVEKPQVRHDPLDFASIKYVRPDFAALSDKIDAFLSLANEGGDNDEVFARADEILDDLNAALTMYALADIKSSLDYTDAYYSEEVSVLSDNLDQLDVKFNELTGYLLGSSQYGSALIEHWGRDFTDCCLSADELNSDDASQYFVLENQLSDQYDAIMKETTVNMYGRSWTYDEVSADSDLDYDSFLTLYNAMVKELNKKAGPLYINMLSTRNNIAKTLGYSSYTEYAYDYHGRDYDPDDARRLQDAVKTYIAPLYSELYDLSYNTNYEALYNGSYDSAAMLPKLYSVMEKLSPNVSESLKYMLTSGLYDVDMRPEKLQGGFTTYLTDLHAPFLYDNWTGSWSSITDATHELGHYNSYYWRTQYGWNVPDGTDIAEVDSQTLVLLSTAYFDELFTGDTADAARMEMVLDTIYSLLSGCMEDEFQQTIYASPDMTLEEMNQLYYELSEEYGFQDVYGTLPEEWVVISHTFQSPLYYISYAAAMVPSAEIWMISLDDQSRAVNVYENVVFRDPYDGFLTVLSEAGLSDPFDPNAIRALADNLKSYAYGLVG